MIVGDAEMGFQSVFHKHILFLVLTRSDGYNKGLNLIIHVNNVLTWLIKTLNVNSLVSEQLTCCVCMDIFDDPVINSCGHNVCRKHISVGVGTFNEIILDIGFVLSGDFWLVFEKQFRRVSHTFQKLHGQCPTCRKSWDSDTSNYSLKDIIRVSHISQNNSMMLMSHDIQHEIIFWLAAALNVDQFFFWNIEEYVTI